MLQIEINKKTIYIYTLLQTQCSQICTWYKLNHDGYDCNNSCLERMQCKNQHLTEILTVLIIANEQRQHNFTRQITSTKDLNWGTWELQTYVMYTNRTPVQNLGSKNCKFSYDHQADKLCILPTRNEGVALHPILHPRRREIHIVHSLGYV